MFSNRVWILFFFFFPQCVNQTNRCPSLFKKWSCSPNSNSSERLRKCKQNAICWQRGGTKDFTWKYSLWDTQADTFNQPIILSIFQVQSCAFTQWDILIFDLRLAHSFLSMRQTALGSFSHQTQCPHITLKGPEWGFASLPQEVWRGGEGKYTKSQPWWGLSGFVLGSILSTHHITSPCLHVHGSEEGDMQVQRPSLSLGNVQSSRCHKQQTSVHSKNVGKLHQRQIVSNLQRRNVGLKEKQKQKQKHPVQQRAEWNWSWPLNVIRNYKSTLKQTSTGATTTRAHRPSLFHCTMQTLQLK